MDLLAYVEPAQSPAVSYILLVYVPQRLTFRIRVAGLKKTYGSHVLAKNAATGVPQVAGEGVPAVTLISAWSQLGGKTYSHGTSARAQFPTVS